MKVWVVEEMHRAGGSDVLAVLVTQPSPEQLAAIAINRSRYPAAERAEWCKVSCEAWDTEDVVETEAVTP